MEEFFRVGEVVGIWWALFGTAFDDLVKFVVTVAPRDRMGLEIAMTFRRRRKRDGTNVDK